MLGSSDLSSGASALLFAVIFTFLMRNEVPGGNGPINTIALSAPESDSITIDTIEPAT